MNKKNTGFIVFTVVFIALVVFFMTIIEGNTGCSVSPKVEEYNAIVTIKDNGDMLVKENFITAGFQEEFYRDLNYQKYNDDNNVYYQSKSNKAYIDMNDVITRVYDENNQEITNQVTIKNDVACEPSSDSCKSVLTRVKTEGTFTSKTTFSYEYTIQKAATKYSDISEINWILFNSSSFKVGKVKVVVNLPSGTYTLNNDNFFVYCYGTSKGEWVKDSEGKKVSIEARKMRTNEVLEFRIMMPNEALSNVTTSSTNYVNNTGVNKKIILDYSEELVKLDNMRRIVANVFFYGTFVLMALMIFTTIKVYKKYDKEYTPKFDLELYRELPREYSPGIMSYMYNFMKTKDEDVTATLMDLIRRKYLELDQNSQSIMDDDADFRIIYTGKSLDDLLSYESFLIKWFVFTIGDGKSVTLKQIENYPKKYNQAEKFQSNGREFSKLIKNESSKYDFFENVKTGKAKALSFILIPIIYLIIVFLVTSSLNIEASFAIIASLITTVVYAIYVGTIKKRSKNGIEDYAMWKAFRQFLLEFTNLKDYPMPSLIIWEHYLVYAISFGIADKVMEQLRVKLPAAEADIEDATFMRYGYRNRNFYYGYTLGRINGSLSSARTNGFNTIASHNASRTGGGRSSGGFGGGSSFGGGGGGIRGR